MTEMDRSLVIVPITTQAETITWQSFKKNVIDVLNADLALCIQTPEDYDFANPYWQFAQYKWTTPRYEEWNSLLDEAQIIELQKLSRTAKPNWRQLFEIQGNWLGAAHDGLTKRVGSGVILLYFRWLLLQHFQTERLLEKYDRFVITRSDFVWECPHPPLEILSPNNVWLGDAESWGGVSDRHTVLSRENIEDYLGIGKVILTEPEELLAEMRSREDWNIEQFIALSLTRLGLREKIAYFPYGMYLVRGEDAGPTWSPGEWNEQLGYFIKYPNEYTSAQELAKIIQQPDDWTSLFSEQGKDLFKALVLNAEGLALAWINDRYVPVELKSLGRIYQDVLMLDRSGPKGSLYRGQSKYGEHFRKYLGDVEIILSLDNTYILKCVDQNGYYGIDAEGQLIIQAEPIEHFGFANKYLIQQQLI